MNRTKYEQTTNHKQKHTMKTKKLTRPQLANLFTDCSLTQPEYHLAELEKHAAQMDNYRKAPLADRREARKDFADTLKDAEHIRERAGWILNGTYGYAAHWHAWQSALNPRTSAPALIGQLLAALDHGCTQKDAAAAFLSLPRAQQDAVNAAIRAEIAERIEAAIAKSVS